MGERSGWTDCTRPPWEWRRDRTGLLRRDTCGLSEPRCRSVQRCWALAIVARRVARVAFANRLGHCARTDLADAGGVRSCQNLGEVCQGRPGVIW